MINIKEYIFSLLFKRPVFEVPVEHLLENKTIIVTGASKGLGYETTQLLLKGGANVVAVSRNKQELVSAFARTRNTNLLLLEGDVTNQRSAATIVQKTLAKFGKIDILINNVGIFIGGPATQISDKDLSLLFGTNVFGGIFMTQSVIPYMKKQKHGSIIFVGSRISHNTRIDRNMTAYASSKYAVEGFAAALSAELAPFGIGVNCIMPGTMDTKRSYRAMHYLPARTVARLLLFVVEHPDVAFESVVIKSLFHQT